MKRVVGLMIGVGLLLSTSFVLAQDLVCIKCHKTIDAVAQNVKKSGAKSADELVDFLRNKSKMKQIHKTAVKDEDIKKAFEAVGKK